MKTIEKIELRPEYVETIPDVSLMEERVLYISREYNVAIHKCLCGCGNQAVTPFKIGEEPNKWWNLTESDKGVTLKPSILNTNCPNRYHYIITNSVANVV